MRSATDSIPRPRLSIVNEPNTSSSVTIDNHPEMMIATTNEADDLESVVKRFIPNSFTVQDVGSDLVICLPVSTVLDMNNLLLKV